MDAKRVFDLANEKRFLLGAAVNPKRLAESASYRAMLERTFNCVVAENVMKFGALQPKRGIFDFQAAEAMVRFAAEREMKVRGHTLVWHYALPSWFQEANLSREEALAILCEHITTVVRHFKGRVFAWDVVNEALDEHRTGLRESSPWYEAIGPDYLEWAFRWAHEADPDALLFYNDYGMEGLSDKAQRCRLLVQSLKEQGVPIHGVGLQCHLKLDDGPEPSEIARNIRCFNEMGLSVHITELDVWIRTATREALAQQAQIYGDMVRVALEARDCPALLVWGVSDADSWVPGFTKGAYDHALLFDRTGQPKPAYTAICKVLGGEAMGMAAGA